MSIFPFVKLKSYDSSNYVMVKHLFADNVAEAIVSGRIPLSHLFGKSIKILHDSLSIHFYFREVQSEYIYFFSLDIS